MKHQHKKNTLILNNFFSIRKLKFGVASITLGSALIIGAHHEAQAAESNNSQGTQNSTTIDQTNKIRINQRNKRSPNQPIRLLLKIQILKITKLLRKMRQLLIQTIVIQSRMNFLKL